MLKHILTGQPSTAGSRHHHHNDYQTSPGSLQGPLAGLHHLHHYHHHHQESASSHHHHFNNNNNNNTSRSGNTTLVSGTGTGGRTGSADVYDSVQIHPNQKMTTASNGGGGGGVVQSSNHSQLSVNNLSNIQHRLNHSNALSLSMLSASKHSVNSTSPVVGNNNNNINNNNVSTTTRNHIANAFNQERPKINGGLDISRLSRLPSQTTPSPAPASCVTAATAVLTNTGGVHNNHGVSHQVQGPTVIPLNASWSTSSLSRNCRGHHEDAAVVAGVKEMLTSLGLLCLVSLLLALLSLIFLLKISPLTVTPSSLISPEEYTIVYEVTLALCALALSLNLCCLLVCAIQFLLAVKLVKTSYQGYRSNKYLQKSSISRVCAVGGFFISIPVFLTGMILYTFIQFHSTPAIVTSAFIGLGIVFCGCAMVHNVFVWQREKTNAVKALAKEQCEAAAQLQRQQQLQQHIIPSNNINNNPSHQLRSNMINQNNCHGKIPTNQNTMILNNPSRGSQYHQQQPHHHHHTHSHPHPRHVTMSPPLLLSSPTALTSPHSHLNISHRNVATPPTTPGDRSPTSPSNNKLNRSQHHVPREASGSISPGLPAATLDLSSAATTNSPHELSTLV